MLPKGPLGRQQFSNLRVYAGPGASAWSAETGSARHRVYELKEQTERGIMADENTTENEAETPAAEEAAVEAAAEVRRLRRKVLANKPAKKRLARSRILPS